jgi:hypothetical protein
VVVAAYLIGAQTAAVDTEDVAVKADEIVPGCFVWRKYKNQINLDAVRVHLSDAKKEKNGALIAGTGTSGWRLTPAGVVLAQQYAKSYASSRKLVSVPATRQWLEAERRRLLGSDAYDTANRRGLSSVSAREAEELFRIDDYVTGVARAEKVERLLHFFGNDPEVGVMLQTLAKRFANGRS